MAELKQKTKDVLLKTKDGLLKIEDVLLKTKLSVTQTTCKYVYPTKY